MPQVSQQLNLTFHGVGTPPAWVSPEEHSVWVKREEFYSILDALAGHEQMSITFDDGNSSDYHIAVPALLERKLQAEFFVLAERVGVPGYLGVQELRQMHRCGMTIGLHGLQHRPWRLLGNKELDAELYEGRSRLEQILGIPVDEAACPFGSYDRRVLRILAEAGYQRVFSSDRGWASSADWMQSRNTIHAADSRKAIEKLMAKPLGGLTGWVREMKLMAKRWR